MNLSNSLSIGDIANAAVILFGSVLTTCSLSSKSKLEAKAVISNSVAASVRNNVTHFTTSVQIFTIGSTQCLYDCTYRDIAHWMYLHRTFFNNACLHSFCFSSLDRNQAVLVSKNYEHILLSNQNLY